MQKRKSNKKKKSSATVTEDDEQKYVLYAPWKHERASSHRDACKFAENENIFRFFVQNAMSMCDRKKVWNSLLTKQITFCLTENIEESR